MDEDHTLSEQHLYGVSKIAADSSCYTYNETYGLGTDIIRRFNLFGPRQKDSWYGDVIAIFSIDENHPTNPHSHYNKRKLI
jgi:UDP-glucose 4-epimerase